MFVPEVLSRSLSAATYLTQHSAYHFSLTFLSGSGPGAYREFEFVQGNKAVMPWTALRYAIELMPPEMKAEAMRRE
jgi:hypothetical protein